ncbi:MAG: lytic transglycosylase domain-containing protein [bacterium]|nr:lytic transglycosylase domain-containing protein [bacterium]
MICQESHFDDQIVSPSGAVGLMQLMPSTAKEQAQRMGQMVRESDLYDGTRNLVIGVAHLGDLMRDLGGDTILTLCAYNAGINAAKRWQAEFGHVDRDVFVERIPYRETRLYVKHILQHIAAYRRLYPDLKLPEPGTEQ